MKVIKGLLLLFQCVGLSCWGAENSNALSGVLQAFYIPNVAEGLGKAVAYDGSNYLVAFQSIASNQISAQLLASTGSPIGASIPLGRTGSLPLVCFDGTNYLVVWVDLADAPLDIYGQFLSPQGSLVNGPFLIGLDADAREVGGIRFDGANYFIVWEGNTGQSNLVPFIQGQFVSPSGIIKGDRIQIASDAESQRLPALCFDGTNYLVAWMAGSNGTNSWDVKARFITTAGMLYAPFTISQMPALSANPLAVAFAETNYLAVWTREVGPYIHEGFCESGTGNTLFTNDWLMLHGRLFSRDGVLANPEFQISHARGAQTHPSADFDGHNFLGSVAELVGDFVPDSGVSDDQLRLCSRVFGR